MQENFDDSLAANIISRSKTHGLDSAFTSFDFADLASEDVLNITLFDMSQQGLLQKIIDTDPVYMLPNTQNKTLSQVAGRCIEALDRKCMWKSFPAGEYALIFAGLKECTNLTTADFVTSAPESVITGKNLQINMHHKDFMAQGALSNQSEYILQIFTALEKEKINTKIIDLLTKKFTAGILKKSVSEIKSHSQTPHNIKIFIKEVMSEYF